MVNNGRGKEGKGDDDGAVGLSPESESERALPRARVRSPLRSRGQGGGGGGEGFVLSPCPDKMHFSVIRRRHARARGFANGKIMILEQLVEQWPRAMRKYSLV